MHGLLDRLNIYRDLKLKGQCKDCIFGKHTMYLYNNKSNRKKKILKRIHIAN